MTARKYGPICSFAGCGRKHNARGLCSPHGAMQRRGELLRPLQDRTGPLPKTDVERFEAKIAHADNGCIVWTGGKTVGGYGVFSVITTHGAEKRDMAHRWAYEFNRGPIPERGWTSTTCAATAPASTPPTSRP